MKQIIITGKIKYIYNHVEGEIPPKEILLEHLQELPVGMVSDGDIKIEVLPYDGNKNS